MTRAVIDLGTNTVLMTIGRSRPDGALEIVDDIQRVGRLGKRVDADGVIERSTFDRIGSIIEQYVAIAEKHGAGSIRCYSTSALRDAANRSEFCTYVKSRTGVEIELLSGDQEAEMTWRGALSGLVVGDSAISVLDIGGGSTEIAVGASGTYDRGVSVDVGAVRVTERCFPNGLPPSDGERAAADQLIDQVLSPALSLAENSTCVGVAGTITTLAAVHAGMSEYDADVIHGSRLETDWVRNMSEELLAMTADQIRQVPGMKPGRADIIGAGTMILTHFLSSVQAQEITVSARGLRFGLLERAFV